MRRPAPHPPPRPSPIPLHRLVLAAVALLCVFVIGAGIAVARLLPRRLELWDVTRVGAGRVTAPAGAAGRGERVRGEGAGAGGAATAAGLTAALGPLLSSSSLGSHVGMVITSLATGQVLYARHATSGFAPASTTKLATAVAALHVLGPDTRFSTRVVLATKGAGASGGSAVPQVILVGGGDPTLAAGQPPAADYPQDATLRALAAQAARALRARGTGRVRLGYDTSLYTGPGLAPGWPRSYVTTGNVTPISSLEVDQGRLTASGAPQDADDPGNTMPRTFTPAPEAASAFAGFLAADGIRVTGGPAPRAAPAGAATLGRVYSPPLAEMVQQMLQESNNVIAENLARHVAIATGQPASFSGAAAAEMSVLRGLGVTGVHLVDGSGLSPRDRITPTAPGRHHRAGGGRGPVTAAGRDHRPAGGGLLRDAGPGRQRVRRGGPGRAGPGPGQDRQPEHGRGAGRHRLRQERPAALLRRDGRQAQDGRPGPGRGPDRPGGYRPGPLWLPRPLSPLPGSSPGVSAASAWPTHVRWGV